MKIFSLNIDGESGLELDGENSIILVPFNDAAIKIGGNANKLCLKNFQMYGKPKGLINTIKFLWKIYCFISKPKK